MMKKALTEKKKEAGNYKKGHLRWGGFEVAIETPKGAVRSGKDAGGKEWRVTMPVDYGYLKRTIGVDGDHVDVFLGPQRDAKKAGTVWVLEQMDKRTGAFDEHKLLAGFATKSAALAAYLKSFSDGARDRVGKVTSVPVGELKAWLKKEGLARRSLDRIDRISGGLTGFLVSAVERRGRFMSVRDLANKEKMTVGERVRGGLVGATAGTALVGTLAGSKGSLKVPNALLKKLRMKPGRLKGGKGKVNFNPARAGAGAGLVIGASRPPKGKAQEVADAAAGYGYMHPSFAELVVGVVREMKEGKPFEGYNPKRHARTGGLNDAFREKVNRETGSNLKRPVTTPPSKLKKGGKAAGRRKSFCARMSGVKGPTSEGGKLTPKGAALKRWNCGEMSAVVKCVRELMTAQEEQKVRRKAGLASDVAKAAYYGTGAVATGLLARKGMKAIHAAAMRQRAVARAGMRGVKSVQPGVQKVVDNAVKVSKNAVPMSELYGDLGRAYVKPKRRIQRIVAEFKRGWKKGQRAAMSPEKVAARKAKAKAQVKQQRAVSQMPRFFAEALVGCVRELGKQDQYRYDSTYRTRSGDTRHGRRHGRFADPLESFVRDLPVTAGGRPTQIGNRQVVGALLRDADRKRVTVQRGAYLARDIADSVRGIERRDSSGRKKKKEWDKQWVKNAAWKAGTALAGGAVLVGRRYARKNPNTPFGKKVMGTERKIRRGVRKGIQVADEVMNKGMGKLGLSEAVVSCVRELAPPLYAGFDPYYSAPGWDLRDARGKSARVFAPNSKRRERREKKWHERVDNIKKMAVAGAGLAAVGGGAAGYAIAKRKSKGGEKSVRAAAPVATSVPAAVKRTVRRTVRRVRR